MRLYIFLFLLLIFAGCNKPNSCFQIEPMSIDLTLLKDTFIYPKSLTIIDTYLIYVDTKEDYFLHIYDIENRRKKFNGFSIGRGPEEMLAPFSITVKKSNEFWIHDYVLRKFCQYFIKNDSIILCDKISFSDSRLSYPGFISDNEIIAVNLMDISKGWISKFDTNGTFLEIFADFPENKDNIPDQIFMESLQGRLAIKPDRKKAVFACRYTDQIQIYNNDGSSVKTYRTTKPFPPIIDIASTKYGWVMGQNEETRFSFVGMTVSNEYIYVLYSGKTRKESELSNYGNYILLLDWNGILRKVIEIKSPAIYITWSAFYKRLYLRIIKDNEYRIAFLEI
ncbi:MAG: hypothetical protein J7K53_12000 [Bacteroidales bacterium]|nr:hypothetical protein [Bacteroidales bacterium]